MNDVIAEPFESLNLAQKPAYAAEKDKLRQRLLAWMEQQGDEGVPTGIKANERQKKQR